MSSSAKTALVTGSSSGIGKAIAERLLHKGYQVVLNYSANDERSAVTLASCRQISPDVVMVKADVSNAEAVSGLVQRAIQEFGSLDVLINNAARVVDRPLLEMSEDDWDSVIDVNLKGAFLCSQAAARKMLTQDDGGVNTCASKAGLMVMTHCLALELGPKIRVNTIVPGLTLTEETEQRFGLSDPSAPQSREEQVPLGRLSRPGQYMW